MNSPLVIRFLLGGALVSFFSLGGDLLKPKSLAGICSASPAVALVIFGFAAHHGAEDFFWQGKGLFVGAMSLAVYCLLTAYLLHKEGAPRWLSPLLAWAQWLAMSIGLCLAYW